MWLNFTLSCAVTNAVHRTVSNSANALFPERHDDMRARYQALSLDSRYGHYVRIPERICRCLDYFQVSSEREKVRERLHAYYLFIGVVDDVLDSNQLEAGREILDRLNSRKLLPDAAKESEAALVTEVFKGNISFETLPTILAKLEELYRAVVSEREAATMSAYIEERKAIGRLTAEVSYLLIRPLIASEHTELCGFLQAVGEVGCLVDSIIDLRADARMGLIRFQPGLKDYLRLASRMLHDGLRILFQHTRLLGLFLEAMSDNVLDFRSRRADARGPATASSGRLPAPPWRSSAKLDESPSEATCGCT